MSDVPNRPSKVTIRFRPVGSTKKIKSPVISVPGNQRFGSLVNYLKRQLGPDAHDSLFCYVNASFAPGLDSDLATLFECYSLENVLNVSYCNTVAFG